MLFFNLINKSETCFLTNYFAKHLGKFNPAHIITDSIGGHLAK